MKKSARKRLFATTLAELDQLRRKLGLATLEDLFFHFGQKEGMTRQRCMGDCRRLKDSTNGAGVIEEGFRYPGYLMDAIMDARPRGAARETRQPAFS